MFRRFLPLAGLVCCFLAGCGQKITPVSGVVLIDGKPIGKGTTVVFIPEGDTPMAGASTDENGRFKLEDVHKMGGLLPGTYKVVLSNYENFIPFPFNASPDNPSDPVLDKYYKDLERLKTQPPKPGMLPYKYSEAGTTPLRYTAPNDGSEVTFDIPSGAVPEKKK
jgi:hypothetical protein